MLTPYDGWRQWSRNCLHPYVSRPLYHCARDVDLVISRLVSFARYQNT